MTTDTTADTTADPTETVVPPRDYGNGDTWADDGPWFVPEELRPYYAAAEPRPIELEGYLTNGIDVVEERSAERVRVIDPGDELRAPTTITETYTADCLVHKHGADYFPAWLHQTRVRVAVRAKEVADRQSAVEAAWLVCAVCGLKASAVHPTRVPTDEAIAHSRRIHVAVCPDHRAALDYAAGRAFAAQEADRLLPDGRRVGDVAAEIIRNRIEG
jgi:hypothetical protein